MTDSQQPSPRPVITDYEADSERYFIGLMEDIFTMMNHARENGVEMPAALRADIAQLLAPEDQEG